MNKLKFKRAMARERIGMSTKDEALKLAHMTFQQRCRVSEQCLPEAPYRAMLVALHDEMLEALAQPEQNHSEDDLNMVAEQGPAIPSARDAASKVGPFWQEFSVLYEAIGKQQITIREIAWRCFLAAKITTLPEQPAQKRQWIWLSDADIAEVIDTTCQYEGSYEAFLIKKAERKSRSMNNGA